MHLRHLFLSLVLVGTAALLPLRAEPTPPPVAVAPVKIYDALDLAALKPLVGQSVTIEGTVARAGESKTKTVRYLNFSESADKGISLVFFSSKGGDAFALEKLQEWVGRKVRVTGKVSAYQERLQLEVEKIDQMKELL